MSRITFSIDTLGCKVNQSESDFIAGELQKRGMEIVSRSRHPDFCIVNTCTVTSQSDRKARQLIRKIKSENKNSRILVTGCFVAFNRKFLKEHGVDFIVRNKDKCRIPGLIADEAAKITAVGSADVVRKTGGRPGDRGNHKSRENGGCVILKSNLPYSMYGGKHSRPLVRVQDGCEQNCTYCIVPEVRGRYKSMPFNDILQRIAELRKDGFEEVVLTGIHIGKYGVGFNAESLHGRTKADDSHRKIKAPDLAELLDRITEEIDIKRIRISSIEINEIGNRLLDVLKRNETRIASHLHIPLQSGSDKILKLMGRPYTSEYYLKKINRIRGIFPDISLTTDVIAGFPGEDEEDFIQTVDAVKEIAFSKIHVFKYSKREHTPAYMMAGQVDEEVKSSRSMILRNLGDELRSSYLKSNIGRTLNVVCEETGSASCVAGVKNKDSDIASGTSENYIKVYFEMKKSKFCKFKGKIVEVNINSVYKNGLWGKLS